MAPGRDRAGEDGGSKEGEMITSDEQALKAIAEKWPEKVIHAKDGFYWDVTWFDYGHITSDDYQALARELGYVIEPRFSDDSKCWYACGIRLEDLDLRGFTTQFPTMLSAMQHGFWKVVELATEKS